MINIINAVFPNTKLNEEDVVKNAIIKACELLNISSDDTTIEKNIQLYNLFLYQMGLILVGPAGSGKSTSLKILFKVLEIMNNNIVIDSYILNPKSINKYELYGKFDENTDTMHDGILTKIIRKTLENNTDLENRLIFIVFDGDIDPVWAENLNSVLDDCKLYTLPNGERMNITRNFRFVFEVQNLK